MAGWQQLLRDNPPAPLDVEQAARIRRTAITAVSEFAARPATRRTPAVVIGSILVSAVAAGLFVAWSQPAPPRYAPSASPGDASLRQLQFATPGGTRIIWEFNPEFTLRETLP